MSFGLRSWLFAITVLLLAEDFQYLLKIDGSFLGQTVSEKTMEETDLEENEESKEESEEKKGEKNQKDDDNKQCQDALSHISALLSGIRFGDALLPPSATAHDLESPPPEV
jgi:hypothetical protein